MPDDALLALHTLLGGMVGAALELGECDAGGPRRTHRG